MEKEKNITVIDIIIRFVKAIQDTPKVDKKEAYYYMYDGENTLWGAKYLLGQILRQWKIDEDHIFVSVSANELWKEIVGDEVSIRGYDYRKKIISKVSRSDVKGYKGASKNHDEKFKIEEGKSFVWNDIFHDDHIIPISKIIDRLLQLKNNDLNHENVKKILNDIAICKITKEENHKLDAEGYKIKRKETLKETIEKIYKQCNIDIVDWEEKKKLIIPNLG